MNTEYTTTLDIQHITGDRSVIRHLYIHIPFCHRRCSYCDFNTYANMTDRMEPYVDALCTEIEARKATIELPARLCSTRLEVQTAKPTPLVPPITRADLLPTIFLGGGTPTMLPLELMERVLEAANTIISLDVAEVTVEANPGTVLGRDYLRSLRAMGVNRISMGVQSLHDPTLRILGRIHTAAEARASYEDARRAGFERINLDFIFGLPGQTLQQWEATLREVATWDVDHFSLYSLILEEGTPLHTQVLGGRVTVPDDDLTGDMYELAMERFAAAGYIQYEISNWARADLPSSQGHVNVPTAGVTWTDSLVHTMTASSKSVQIRSIRGNPCSIFNLDAALSSRRDPRSVVPPQACHHNLAYWLNANYLACGAGAHGHVFPHRYYDVLGINDYIRQVQQGSLPVAEVTALDEHDLYSETMFMGLRLNIGVSYAHFRDRCGVELDDVYGPVLDELASLNLLERDEVGVRLTDRGRMFGNQVFARFV